METEFRKKDNMNRMAPHLGTKAKPEEGMESITASFYLFLGFICLTYFILFFINNVYLHGP